jgi:hypothetical protein
MELVDGYLLEVQMPLKNVRNSEHAQMQLVLLMIFVMPMDQNVYQMELIVLIPPHVLTIRQLQLAQIQELMEFVSGMQLIMLVN